ncbi:MAG TPA: hypothetical protein VGN26_13510 [Armatimonadota bacterium]
MAKPTRKRPAPVVVHDDFDEEDSGPINLFRCCECGRQLRNFPNCYATWNVKARCERCATTTAAPIPAGESSVGVAEAVSAWQREPQATEAAPLAGH